MDHIEKNIENYASNIQACMIKCINVDQSTKTKGLAFKCLDLIYLSNDFDIHNVSHDENDDMDEDDDDNDDDIEMFNDENEDDNKQEIEAEGLNTIINNFFQTLNLGSSVCKETGMYIYR